MNSHHGGQSQVQPAVPLPHGRPGHLPYTPPPYSNHPPPYQGYAYQYPMQYSRPPQQWAPYPMFVPMGRGYQQYQHMQQIQQMNPYPVHQHYPSMRPSPQQAPSTTSIHSARGFLSPTSSNKSLPVPASIPPSIPANSSSPRPAPPMHTPSPAIAASSHRLPFYPPLPWQSFEGDFPPRRPRRRREPAAQSSTEPVELPDRQYYLSDQEATVAESASVDEVSSGIANLETPLTSQPPSEVLSTQPTSPSSTVAAQHSTTQQTTPKVSASGRPSSFSIPPIVPAIPNMSATSRQPKQPSMSLASDALKLRSPSSGRQPLTAVDDNIQAGSADVSLSSTDDAVKLPAKVVQKTWADLVRTVVPPISKSPIQANNGVSNHINGVASNKAGSLADALSSYGVKDGKDGSKVSFLEPRGLVNTGNMCYMNSILQVLVFCVPFYIFLEKVGQQAAHSFKNDTPMVDAMIMFMREFSVIDAAVSVDQLRLRLKENELEQYGETFIPEFVYDVVRRLPRFSSMRRGHQQDAEEFLGFLLEEMHDECSKSMRSGDNKSSSGASTPTNGTVRQHSEALDSLIRDENTWLEVGPKQKAAITRSSGAIATESPITKIFGGKLRSELRVPGMKTSVTLEPYQPLQLDIGAPNVSNIVDALKGLTKPETLHGDFDSPRGPGTTATKQVSIETLPQVLILHLKRFQYDSAGGTQKIWKKVGYPLDLEIPKELFAQHKRSGFLAHGGPPKYRLIGVVYHHGKNASGGHYTVDVRRQEGREWIRLDDTIIRRIRSEDVAEGGGEEDPKVLAAALERHRSDNKSVKDGNVYEQIGGEDEDSLKPEKPWNQVNGSATGPTAGKKWSSVANGNATPSHSSGKRTPMGRLSVKDNKVAYILFYRKVET